MATFIFLDDIRNPPDDGNEWYVVRKMEDALDVIIGATHVRRDELIVSLDHDLGQDEYGIERSSGYDLVRVIEEMIGTDPTFRPRLELRIHSANPVGRQNMERGIRSIYRLLEQ